MSEQHCAGCDGTVDIAVNGYRDKCPGLPAHTLDLDSPDTVERLARALRSWRGVVFVDPKDPDRWFAESAAAIVAALREETLGS